MTVRKQADYVFDITIDQLKFEIMLSVLYYLHKQI